MSSQQSRLSDRYDIGYSHSNKIVFYQKVRFCCAISFNPLNETLAGFTFARIQ